MRVTAVVVTRGDQDISQVLDSLKQFDQVIVWDNSKQIDMKVYGRFCGAICARNEIVYVQDDDCLINSSLLVADYEKHLISCSLPVLCNFPVNRRNDYLGTDIALIGWGTIFNRSHVECFRTYLNKYPQDDLFLRECDRIFTYLNRRVMRLTEVGLTHLPYAYGNDRMGKESRHGMDLQTVRSRLNHIDNFLRGESLLRSAGTV